MLASELSLPNERNLVNFLKTKSPLHVFFIVLIFRIKLGFYSDFRQLMAQLNTILEFPYFYVQSDLYNIIKSVLVARDDGRFLWVSCDQVDYLPALNFTVNEKPLAIKAEDYVNLVRTSSFIFGRIVFKRLIISTLIIQF